MKIIGNMVAVFALLLLFCFVVVGVSLIDDCMLELKEPERIRWLVANYPETPDTMDGRFITAGWVIVWERKSEFSGRCFERAGLCKTFRNIKARQGRARLDESRWSVAVPQEE